MEGWASVKGKNVPAPPSIPRPFIILMRLIAPFFFAWSLAAASAASLSRRSLRICHFVFCSSGSGSGSRQQQQRQQLGRHEIPARLTSARRLDQQTTRGCDGLLEQEAAATTVATAVCTRAGAGAAMCGHLPRNFSSRQHRPTGTARGSHQTDSSHGRTLRCIHDSLSKRAKKLTQRK
jgi:hypothetical protein